MPEAFQGMEKAALIALLASLAVTGWLATMARKIALDHPGRRSLHVRPTPRTGGIGLLAGVLAGIGWTFRDGSGLPPPFDSPAALSAFGLLAAVSFLDDLGHVPIPWRLLVQGLAAGVLAQLSGTPLAWLPIVIPGLVWMVNLYNFMDGMDGFAGGMTVFGFGTLATVAWQSGHPELGILPGVVVAAALGFLAWNFPPARIFLGDAGATFLGMLAGWLLLTFHLNGILPLWLGMLVFAPFIVDATVTLLRRAGRGERFWEAHRDHYYQRLVRRGWSHRRTVLAEYLLMAGCGATALLVHSAPSPVQWGAIAAWGVMLGALMGWVDVTERTR